MARRYRAFAETTHLSGDIQGSANAIARADSQDYKAHRLQYKNTHQRRRRAEKRASSSQENNYRRQAENHSSPAMPSRRDIACPEKEAIEHAETNVLKPAPDILEQLTPSPQDPPVRVDSLEPKSPSPDEHREEKNAPESAPKVERGTQIARRRKWVA
jgi:hypothetical protein